MIDARAAIGSHDVLWVTLDALRYDAAELALRRGLVPRMQAVMPDGRWEKRHTPGSFTYAAHQAFFAGFLPTPEVGLQPRLFASRFAGSETTGPRTFVFDAPDVPSALAERGYHTVCIGGVGFFNPSTSLGRVLPGLFAEQHWSEAMGVTSARSTEVQVDQALRSVHALPDDRRVFVFLNVSAVHQPNRIFLADESAEDGVEGQVAALAYADTHLGRLLDGMRRRAPLLMVLCSDHGTAYGEDGLWGHRVAHPVVWLVPYAEAILERAGCA